MKITIIGTGYVGLVTGTIFAEVGHDVTCLDINEDKIILLQSGKSPIYEPGLDMLLQNNIVNGRLCFTSQADEAFADSDVIFIAVGTPQEEDGSANLNYIHKAAEDIARHIKHNVIVVVKSTVPVGTNDYVEKIIRNHISSDIEVHVVSNPEFLREGHAIHDTMNGDRIIIGAEHKASGDVVEALYEKINVPILRTDRRSAEMIKYASNAFLAVKISYINQISNLCEKLGADIASVADGMGMDKRIGRAFLNAGLGYGGSCFPKDTRALSYLSKKNNVSMSIVEAAIEANTTQRQLFINKVVDHFNGNVTDKRVAVLGLAFKPNTDDVREAPSIDIITALVSSGAKVSAYDPVVKNIQVLDDCNVVYAQSKEICVENADAILLVTEWDEFFENEWLASVIQNKQIVLFDGRNMLNKNKEEILS